MKRKITLINILIATIVLGSFMIFFINIIKFPDHKTEKTIKNIVADNNGKIDRSSFIDEFNKSIRAFRGTAYISKDFFNDIQLENNKIIVNEYYQRLLVGNSAKKILFSYSFDTQYCPDPNIINRYKYYNEDELELYLIIYNYHENDELKTDDIKSFIEDGNREKEENIRSYVKWFNEKGESYYKSYKDKINNMIRDDKEYEEMYIEFREFSFERLTYEQKKELFNEYNKG